MRHFKIKIPDTFRLHLTEDILEKIVLISTVKEIVMCDIEYIVTSLYPTRRRAVRAIIKQLNDCDFYHFNSATNTLRNCHFIGDCYVTSVCSSRSVVHVTKV